MVPGILTKDRELVDADGEIVTDPPGEDRGDDDEIEIEEPDEDLDATLSDLDDQADDEADARLNLELDDYERAIQEIDDSQPARQVDQKREQAHGDAGAKGVAAAERIVLNAAREPVQQFGKSDPRVIGYVRVSGTGTPCGWCAMLISRGVVYRTKESAGEDNTWHDNCHCYAEPVYSMEQYESDPRFDLNREMSDLWPKVTKGFRGDKAISVWRHFIRYEWQPDQALAA